MFFVSDVLILDLEAFHHKNQPIFVKELSVCRQYYNETILFQAPSKFSYLAHENKSLLGWQKTCTASCVNVVHTIFFLVQLAHSAWDSIPDYFHIR